MTTTSSPALPYLAGPPNNMLDGGGLTPVDVAQYVNCAPTDLLYPGSSRVFRLTVYTWLWAIWDWSTLAERVLRVFDGANGLQVWTDDAAAPLPPAPVVANTDSVVTFQVFSLGNGANVTLEQLIGTLQFNGHLAVARIEALTVEAPASSRAATDTVTTQQVAPTVDAAPSLGAALKQDLGSFWGSVSGAFKGAEYVIIALAVIAVVALLVYFIPAAPVRGAVSRAGEALGVSGE